MTAAVHSAIAARLKGGNEQRLVVGPLVEYLCSLGWSLDQMRFGKQEWRVPSSPSEASKRESGKSFAGFPCDIAIFDDPKHAGDFRHLHVVVECKQPDDDTGVEQLEVYLGREPYLKLGVFANNPALSAGAVFAYIDRSKDLTRLLRRVVADLPHPGDPISPTSVAVAYQDLVPPSSGVLQKAFANLLDRVVARDAEVTRREEQLDQLCNLLLLKLNSDLRASASPAEPVPFRPRATPGETAREIRREFTNFVAIYPDIFARSSDKELRLADGTIHECVEGLYSLRLLEAGAETIATAFQVLRSAALKQEEGQYFTPRPVIEAAVKLMQIDWGDLIIDPACGTGGFLIECLRSMQQRYPGKQTDVSRWAQTHLFGIDKDAIGIKLTKAIMQILGDGSAHCARGDSVLTHTWASDYRHLKGGFYDDGRFTLAFTNPPFGRDLTVARKEAIAAGLDIVDVAPTGKDIELGLAMLNRCYQLLRPGGRLCIVLPETYFFSPSYRYVRDWCAARLEPQIVVNVPMEAFQGFCRAKTNLYIFRKV